MRYYQLPGGATAYRTGNGTTDYGFELTDQHGTPTLYLDSTAQAPTWRQYTPYGEPRAGAAPTFDNHGFLGKPTAIAVGLTMVGARDYDATTGRFISLDPVLETTDPQQLNGYSYAANNPVTGSDPTGLCAFSDGDLCASHGTDGR